MSAPVDNGRVAQRGPVPRLVRWRRCPTPHEREYEMRWAGPAPATHRR
jgi:hypothetical protein